MNIGSIGAVPARSVPTPCIVGRKALEQRGAAWSPIATSM
jgi:hypothetical protein